MTDQQVDEPDVQALRDEVATADGEDGTVEMPFEAGSATPQPLRYADLGAQYRYEPGRTFREAQKAVAKDGDVVPDEPEAQDTPTEEGEE